MTRWIEWIVRLGSSGLLVWLVVQIVFAVGFVQYFGRAPTADEHGGYNMLAYGAAACLLLTGCLLSCQRIILSTATLLMLCVALITLGEARLDEDVLLPQLIVIVVLVGIYIGLLAARPKKKPR